jgi:uncharacterized membrane-anchored protein
MTTPDPSAVPRDAAASRLAKVPQVTLAFWIVKILATTLGETGGDAVTMSMGLGYLVGTGIFALLFAVAVAAQLRARTYNPALYWFTIVATTTVGTTLADYVDRSLGIGYAGGSALLLALLLASLATWRLWLGSVAVSTVATPAAEGCYWVTILCSQTLGTALGDWTADTEGVGYGGGALIFGGLLLLVVLAWRFTRTSRTVLFWLAFVLTRPLGAVLGDLLDKPVLQGGLELSRYSASAALLAAMLLLLWLFPGRADRA